MFTLAMKKQLSLTSDARFCCFGTLPLFSFCPYWYHLTHTNPRPSIAFTLEYCKDFIQRSFFRLRANKQKQTPLYMNDDVLYETEVGCVSGNHFSSHNTVFLVIQRCMWAYWKKFAGKSTFCKWQVEQILSKQNYL